MKKRIMKKKEKKDNKSIDTSDQRGKTETNSIR